MVLLDFLNVMVFPTTFTPAVAEMGGFFPFAARNAGGPWTIAFSGMIVARALVVVAWGSPSCGPGHGRRRKNGMALCVGAKPCAQGWMSKEDLIELQGVVTEVLAGGNYKVKCGENHEVLARLNGKMRQFRIRVIAGDRVTVGVSPYDLKRGLITYRAK